MKKPEEYRWCSLEYHAHTGNLDGFLSTDFGLREFAVKGEKERLAHYRRFAYEKGPGTQSCGQVPVSHQLFSTKSNRSL